MKQKIAGMSLFGAIKLIVILYCIIGIALYYLQEKLLFRPTAMAPGDAFTFNTPFTEANISYDENTRFNIVQFLPANDSTAKGVVIYFHGNRENVNRYSKFANNFTQHGYEVWMPDYPGYGKSTGKLTEQTLYAEALQVYQLAKAKFPQEKIILYGKSLGSGIATQLASVRDCKRLILETPYYSIASLSKRFFWMYPVDMVLKYKIPQNEYLQKVVAPVSIFHGTDDWVITYNNALRLKSLLKPTDEFITIEKGDHHNLNDFAVFHQKLDSLLEN